MTTDKRKKTSVPIKAAKAKSPHPTAPSAYQMGGVTFVMPDSPLTPRAPEPEEAIARLEDEEEYAQRGESQKRLFEELADRIQRGDDSLMAYECLLIAGAVRAYAAQIHVKKPKGRGQAPKLDPLLTVSRYLQLRLEGLNISKAKAKLAEELETTEVSINVLFKKHEPQISIWMENLNLKKK